ncbi:Polysaccharide export protein [Azotobacter vinelandii CA]|uniref:Type IV secretion system putative lipoprotein virB7 n=2 Tax=Azotobacter vinelandii TaxID=354 RepID=C1DKC8_AZOVD|nr:polysaccharide biosynthesis/export family protein [Azotobacter vinelandii]ACO76791.1 Polysaccharide export protein [Azotobacter vinelandii DJ]AGK17256.1 Polysaccharide export protein [Azotobacter vinelandii CA]AGK19373.1 Polysaccharide export protein [Azotobacter vinelandii CA6]WKN22551.1 polysaccharide biosynthesis/export family protein [Azotobacter vinelandii]SFX67719.1 polysaccharide export outer membrane protein [Azotobacter vinelandii]
MNKPLLFLLALLALAGCSSQRSIPAYILTAPEDQATHSELIPVTQVLRPQDVLDVIFHIEMDSPNAYRIQPGDQLEILFATAKGLTGIKTVMPDGTVNLEYVGSLQVAGLTVDEAQALMTERYKDTLRTPLITVSVAKAQTRAQNLRDTLFSPNTGMSREITVGADGRATFPMLGSIRLGGMNSDELEKLLNERYREEVGPIQVDVLLKSTAANEVYILGEVGQPGAYPVRRPISVLEALTLARGYNPVTADLESVLILHRDGERVVSRTYDMEALLDNDADSVAYLQPDDLLFVPRSSLAGAGDTMRQLADVMLFSGFNFGFSYQVDDKDEDD